MWILRAHQVSFVGFTKRTRAGAVFGGDVGRDALGRVMARVEPYHSRGETGCKPVGLETMLRVYFLRQWFALSDPAAERRALRVG